MREKDITPEVIRLSKEIAELWKMEIYVGCWAILRWPDPFLIEDDTDLEWAKEQKIIPIPSISDCLEKLRELGYFYLVEYVHEGYALLVFDGISEYRSISKDFLPTHEALLSALLEVLA